MRIQLGKEIPDVLKELRDTSQEKEKVSGSLAASRAYRICRIASWACIISRLNKIAQHLATERQRNWYVEERHACPNCSYLRRP